MAQHIIKAASNAAMEDVQSAHATTCHMTGHFTEEGNYSQLENEKIGDTTASATAAAEP